MALVICIALVYYAPRRHTEEGHEANSGVRKGSDVETLTEAEEIAGVSQQVGVAHQETAEQVDDWIRRKAFLRASAGGKQSR